MRFAVLAVLGCLLVQPAWATDHLEEAKKLVAQMKYDQALWHLNMIVKSGGSGPEELVNAYLQRGYCYVALRKSKLAVHAFRSVLAIDPDFRLDPKASPRFRPAFRKARTKASKTGPIVLRHAVPKPGKNPGGLNLAVKLKANPLGLIKKLRLVYWESEGKKKRLVRWVKRKSHVAFRLPDDLVASEVRYFFEATNRAGAVFKRAGSADDPYRYAVGAKPPVAAKPDEPPAVAPKKAVAAVVAPPAAEPGDLAVAGLEDGPTDDGGDENGPAWYETWWFWTSVGVVVAGATTGIVLATTGGDEGGAIEYEVYLR